jgi:Apea-like HEPN
MKTVGIKVEPVISPSLDSKTEKLTVVPLTEFGVFENVKKPPCGGIDLGFGVSVEDFSEQIKKLDVSSWKGASPDIKVGEIQNWATCLVHRYEGGATSGSDERTSVNFLGYVIAHLRLLAPNRTTVADRIHLVRAQSGELNMYSLSKAAFWPQINLSDCEKVILGTKLEHLETLKAWLPWISQFCKNWEEFYPLWVSLHFAEKYYTEWESFRVRHLFRVMALEALLCADKDYGQLSLRAKLPKLLGWRSDLYASYQNEQITYFLDKLPLTDKIIEDIYTLRNKVAHGDRIPTEWQKKCRSGFCDGDISYAAVLTEAAGSMLRSVWLRILKENLQNTFGDKKKMQKFFHE